VKRAVPWAVTAVAVAVLFLVLHNPARAHGVEHPTPRPGITAAGVLPPSLVPNEPGALEAYAAARRVPQVLDGLYCHCHCSQTVGHRSLLTCFQTEHGAACDICQGEAMLADELAAKGASLADIRRAIDGRFGS
jgi:hypothetical protein